jgi:hypothetical protein
MKTFIQRHPEFAWWLMVGLSSLTGVLVPLALLYLLFRR